MNEFPKRVGVVTYCVRSRHVDCTHAVLCGALAFDVVEKYVVVVVVDAVVVVVVVVVVGVVGSSMGLVMQEVDGLWTTPACKHNPSV